MKLPVFGLMVLGIALLALVLPAEAGPRAPRENYILRCAGCHGMEGAGTKTGGVPSFYGGISLLANDDAARTYMMHVPGVIGASLSDAEIAEVMNWINHKWGSAPAPDFTEAEVTRRRAVPVGDVVVLRRDLATRFAAEGKPLPEYPWP